MLPIWFGLIIFGWISISEAVDPSKKIKLFQGWKIVQISNKIDGFIQHFAIPEFYKQINYELFSIKQ